MWCLVTAMVQTKGADRTQVICGSDKGKVMPQVSETREEGSDVANAMEELND